MDSDSSRKEYAGKSRIDKLSCGSGRKERIVTQDGRVIAGEKSSPEVADGIGYISHFATCGK